MVGELLSAVLVAVADATRDQRLAGLLGDGRLVERHRIDPDAEEEQLPGVEPLGLRAVEPAEDRVDFRLLLGLQPQPLGFELLGRLLPDALDQRVVLDAELLPLLAEQSLEQGRIVGQFVDAGHATRCTEAPSIAPGRCRERLADSPPQAVRVATTVRPESNLRSWPPSIATAFSSPAGNRNVPRSSRL